MNLAQFQIILQKINALHKNINMDGKISNIEKDLMKAYVSQLYEACVNGEPAEAVVPAVIQETKIIESAPPVKVETAPPVQVETSVQEVVKPQTNVSPPQPVATPTYTNPPAEQPVQQPIQQIEQSVAVSNAPKELNDSVAAHTKTIADKLSNGNGRSINDRLADANNKGKTFNDKFNKKEPAAETTSAPILIKIPDSLKHMDNSNPSMNSVSATPTPTVTPPPPPPPATPVQKVKPVQPVVKSVSAPKSQAGGNNINAAYALFDDATAAENAGKWGSTPIPDLAKAIGLNDKISMIKELFSDDHHAFNNALTQLNTIGGFGPAKDYMMRNLVTVYSWTNPKSIERAKQFINLVRRRYL